MARGRFVNQRAGARARWRPNAIAVVPEDDGGFTVWVLDAGAVRRAERPGRGCSTWTRSRSASIAPDVGGGFGAKLLVYPEYRGRGGGGEARSAGRCGGPRRARRAMLNLNHGRAQVQTVELGATRDGTLVGMRVELLADMGAYPIGAFLPTTTQEMLCGVYDDPARARARGCERGHERHAGRGLSRRRPAGGGGAGRARDGPARRRARHGPRRGPPEEPDPAPTRSRTRPRPARRTTSATTSARSTRRCGSPAYESSARSRRRGATRGDHVLLGIGVSTYVEITAFAAKEFGSVEVRADGTVTVLTGISPHGQGHETAFAQIASAVLRRAVRDGACDPLATPASCRGARARGARVRCRSAARRSSTHERGGRREGARAWPRTCSRSTRPTSPSRARRVRGAGRARPRDQLGASWRRPRRPVAAAGGRWTPGLVAQGTFREPELDVPVRRARGGRRGRHRDRRRAAGAPRRGRRLRPDPEPDARRRAGARRAGAGHRAGAVRGGPLRRDRQPDDGNAHDVPDAVGGGAAVVRDRRTPRRRRR